ncbi:L-rhamnose-binding lectin CSL3-like isoform X1 [Clavelina lepadiformis]|uniref:L-rhamnose-binding lectin CSL3-like isoform X1 n=1 Tax=Clavelina lepadiformis TaxID=159417 RepID=UPI00404278E0
MNFKVCIFFSAVIILLSPERTNASVTTFACEHETPVRVKCPSLYVIDVIDAFYGRLEHNRCGSSSIANCKAGNSLTVIKQNCQGENSCSLEASNLVFGDPCRGVVKYIKLVYDCLPAVSEKRTTYACEHQSPVQVQCPEYFRIDVIDAFYGRLESDKCGYNTNTNCKAENSLSIIKNNCQYENTCLLTAENSLFGDPCAGVVKYSKLVYQCVPTEKERLAVACEHEKDLTVTCPDGYVIIVHYAFYGRDDLTTCRQGQTDSNCRANGSNEKVQRVCRGRNSCVLSPKNSVFGDPCSGVVKFIKMYYSCVPSEEL